MEVDESEARDIARALLAEALPRRWRHVQAVAAKALASVWSLPEHDRAAVAAAAWLHDVGYAPTVADTGLHALDGARWLRGRGVEPLVYGLVAYHSCAIYEAEERGLADALREEFPQEQSLAADLLWYCDMTTGPDGEDLEVLARLAEVRRRYGPDDLVTRFWRRAEPVIVDVVRRVERRLVEADSQPM